MVHPVIGNPNKTASFRKIFNDPLFVLSIFVKLVLLLFFSLYLGNWYSSDTNHYLMAAEKVCRGEWGGDSFRGSFYLWYLCISSLGKVYKGTELLSGGGVNLSLVIQALIVVLIGIFLYRKFGRKISLIWMFDPVISVYSVFVMSDILFGVFALLFSFYFYQLLKNKNKNIYAIFVGILWGALVLTRPIAIPFSYFHILFIFILFIKKYISSKSLATIVVTFLLVLSPKLFWNYQKSGEIYITEQTQGWLQSIAGMIANDEKGLSFHEGSMSYFKENPNANTSEILKVIQSHIPRAIYLTSKSVLRVLFGHVNIEANYLFTGKTIEGPGWFKKPESALGPPLQDQKGIIIWIIGLIYSSIWCAWIYFGCITTIIKVRHFDFISSLKELYIENIFWFWSLVSILIFSFLPLIVGDARFRIPILGFVLVMYGIALKVKRLHSEHSID